MARILAVFKRYSRPSPTYARQPQSGNFGVDRRSLTVREQSGLGPGRLFTARSDQKHNYNQRVRLNYPWDTSPG